MNISLKEALLDRFCPFILKLMEIVLWICLWLFVLLMVFGFFCLAASFFFKIFRGFSHCIKLLKSNVGKTTTLTTETQSEQAATALQEPPAVTQHINSVCFIAIGHLGQNADDSSINYAFVQEEISERVKIVAAVEGKDAMGCCSCELDFPVSQRSLEWLRYSGFEVSQAEGITKVSWENAKP